MLRALPEPQAGWHEGRGGLWKGYSENLASKLIFIAVVPLRVPDAERGGVSALLRSHRCKFYS